jgi:hypothetical protein
VLTQDFGLIIVAAEVTVWVIVGADLSELVLLGLLHDGSRLIEDNVRVEDIA